MGTIKPNARRAHRSDSQAGLVTELTDNCGPAGHKLPLAIVLIAVITGLTEEPGWSGLRPAVREPVLPTTAAALVVSLTWAV